MAKQPRILTGKVAAITGGGRGIGRAMAQAFVREGMKVALGDLDLDVAKQTAQEIGSGTEAFELDVTKHGSVVDFADAVEAKLGPIDVFVNNAGIMQLGRFLDEDDATAHRMVDINIHGVEYGMKVVLPRMVQRNRGHMINVASQAGKFGLPGGATYVATKFAVVGLTEAVRGELRLMGADGVDMSVVMPAIVNTELGGGLTQTRGSKTLQPEDVAEATVEALKTGRYEVWVPKQNKGLYTSTQLMPRPMRDAMTKALKGDQTLWSIDTTGRRAYELRASKSEPGLEPGQEPDELTERAGSSS
jgi:short-subunit dehydrogenase